MLKIKITSIFFLVSLLSSCSSFVFFSKPIDQKNPDEVANAYINYFYSGDIRSIKKILEPKELASIQEEPDSMMMFQYVEGVGAYIRRGGGYKNMKITKIDKYSNDNKRTYYYDIDLPHVTNYKPTELMGQYSSVDVSKDENGLWWVSEIDGVTNF